MREGTEEMDEKTGQASGRDAFERVETLIPYREPTWKPEKRLGKLNLDNSIWSIATKLGRFLLSGKDEVDLDEVSRAAAAYFLGAEVDELIPAPEEDLLSLEKRILRTRVGDEGTYAAFRQPGTHKDSDPYRDLLIVVARDKADRYSLGDNHWQNGAHINVMRLPVLVGLMEIIEEAGGKDVLPTLAARAAEDAYLAEAKAAREWFGLMESQGRVTVNPDARYLDFWAAVDYIAAGTGSHATAKKFLYENDRVMIEGTASELAAEACVRGSRAAERVPRDLELILKERGGKNDKAIAARLGRGDKSCLARALRDAARSRWDVEACHEENRRYAEHAEHIAGVFDDKKQCDEAHRAAAKSGYVARSFKHVEIDDEVDLARYGKLACELEARMKSRELPQIATDEHELRFRKCGRHRALGLYSPRRKAVAVDPRAPRSLLHEFAHAYDFEHGQLSASAEFRPIVKAFAQAYDPKSKSGGKADYYRSPAEVFARSWETYAARHGFGGSFVEALDTYEASPAYAPLIENAALLDSYFDGFARPLEVARPVSAQERAVEVVREGDEQEFAALRRQVASGEVDAFRLRADLGGGMGLAAEEERRMGELMAASLLAPSARVGPEDGEAVEQARLYAADELRRGHPEEPARAGEQMSLF